MNEKFEALLAKIDALSLRERLFMVFSVIACCVALVDTLWLSPALTANKKLTQQFAAQSTELASLREELKRVAVPVDPSKAVRDDIAAVQQRLDALNRDLGTYLPQAKDVPALEYVLVQFLRRHEGLTLLGLSTLKSDMAPPAGATGQPAGALAGLTRSGMELRVSGPYSEMVNFVKKLEAALPALRWGAMVLKSETQPPELTLQVFVLGVQAL